MSPLEARLTTDNARLLAVVEGLRSELTALRLELAAARQDATTHKGELRSLKNEYAAVIDRLDQLLAIVKGQKKPKAKGKPKDDDDDVPPSPARAITDEQRQAFEDRPRPGPPPEPESKEPKTQSRPGRRPPPGHIPKDESSSKPTKCTGCGSDDLVVDDSRLVQHLDASLQMIRNRRTRLQDCLCKTCGVVVRAERPPLPFERAKVTCEMLAWLMYMVYGMLVPLDRLRLGLGANRVFLSIGYLVKLKERAAELLDKIDGYHMKVLLTRPWIGVDGTGHKVIIKDVPGTHHGYLEVFCNPDIVVFQFALNKKAETLVERLVSYRGTVLCDAESRNGLVFESGRVEEAGCNGHLLRSMEEAAKEQPLLASEGLGFIGRIYDRHRDSLKLCLAGAEMLAYRKAHIQPIYAEMARWRNAVEPLLDPSDSLAKVLRYITNQWKPLTRWLSDARLPPDNNACEREFQRIAKGRLSWRFFGGPEGGHRAATSLGVVATCHRIGVDALAYLAWAFNRLGTAYAAHGKPAASTLTPAAYKAGLNVGTLALD